MRRLAGPAICAVLLSIPLWASAQQVEELQRSSEVTADVQFNDPVYGYMYTVFNTSIPGWIGEGEVRQFVTPVIIDYEIPLGGADYAFNILSPDGWLYELLSAEEYVNAFAIENPYDAPYVLHWYMELVDGPMDPIRPGESLSGFYLESYLSPIDGPYLTSWWDEERNIGDPPLPGGLVGGGTVPFRPLNGIVPEPASLLLVAGGVGGFVLRLRRRNTA